MKTTNGIWKVRHGSDCTEVGTYTNSECYPLAEIIHDETYDSEIDVAEAEGNAYLISAAKELYNALKTVYDSTAVLNHLDPECQHMICDAIAKAEGK